MNKKLLNYYKSRDVFRFRINKMLLTNDEKTNRERIGTF